VCLPNVACDENNKNKHVLLILFLRLIVFVLLLLFYYAKHKIVRNSGQTLQKFAEIKDYSILIDCGGFELS
jgi:hypothetical protein